MQATKRGAHDTPLPPLRSEAQPPSEGRAAAQSLRARS